MEERREQFNYEGPTFKLQISHFYRQINWDESDDDGEGLLLIIVIARANIT